MSPPRVAFVTNLCPYYRRPLFEGLAERLDSTFYFFSEEEEAYLGSSIRHEAGELPVREVRRIKIAGTPVLAGLEDELFPDRYDVVVKCLNGRLMAPYVYNLSRRRKIPFVLWTEMWRHPRTAAHMLSKPMVKKMYRGSNAIIAFGSHVKKYVESMPGVPKGKTFVVVPAVDMAPFLAVEPKFGTPPAVLFIGRLEPSKGIDELVTAFADINRDARLRVIGVGSAEEQLWAAASRDSRIEVVGHVPNDKIPRELERARCLVLPSITTRRFREPWGLVVNEAMASGVPVVTSNAVGAAAGGLVRDGQNGFEVPERDRRALATAVNRLVGDSTLARRLGAQARIDVSAVDHARMVETFVDAIDHAL